MTRDEIAGPTPIRFYSKGGRLGLGWRLVIAFDPGRRFVRLLDPWTLAIARVGIDELAHARLEALAPKRRRRLARIADHNRRAAKRRGQRVADKTIRQVVAAMKQETGA